MTVDEILILGDRYLAQVAISPGGIGLDGSADHLRLVRVPVHFHEQDADQLCACLANVAKTTILANGGAIISDDHHYVWAWCLQMIAYSGKQFLANEEERLFRSALHLALMELPTRGTPTHCAAVSHDSSHHLAYCAFPLLEHVCKASVSAWIDNYGSVLKAFHLAGDRPYPVGSICSNFGTVLRLYLTHGSSPLTAKLFNYFLTHLAAVEGGQYGASILTKWRNAALHGTERQTYVGAALLCLALVVAVDKYRSEFEARADEMVRMLEAGFRFRHPSADRGPFIVYPPA